MGIKIQKVYNVEKEEVVAMAKDIDYSKIGLRISSLRKKAGLTQEVLAARCGCTSNHLSNVEVGKCKPSLDLVIRLAMELNSSVDFFLLGTPHASCQYLLHSQIGPKLDHCSVEDLQYIEGLIDNFLRYKEAVTA